MPPPMAGPILKGSFMRKLDFALNDPAKREAFRARLAAKRADGSWNEGVLDVATEIMGLSTFEQDHVARHWFDPLKSWWPRHQPIDIVVRLGVIQLVELATERGPDGRSRSVDCYWIAGVDLVQVSALVSPTQVTGILMTPGRPLSDRIVEDYAGATEREPIYTVRHRSRGPGEQQFRLDEAFCEFVQPLRAKGT
jgi:hypothetical protein